MLDAFSLEKLFALETEGLDAGNLTLPAWTSDGQAIFAAGGLYVDGLRSIVRWPGAGEGQHTLLDGPAGATVTDVLPWGGRGIVFSSAAPSFGRLDDAGRMVLHRRSMIADLRGKLGEHFTVSADASKVRFGLGTENEDPWLLDVAALRFAPSTMPPAGLAAADVAALPVTDWQHTTAPKLNGAPLQLDEFENARSLAVLSGAGGLILGSDWHLRCFDAKGQAVWKQQSPSVAWGLNASADGRLAVAAYGDGTIRWHRASDGRELLAFFTEVPEDSSEPRRWVAWTPKGYYAASAGGEDLIGWHVDRGANEAPDFFPASRFRDRFYRPDVVKLVLATLDEERAITEANRSAGLDRADEDVRNSTPPVVTIVSPGDNATFSNPSVSLNYTARLPSGEAATDIDVLIDGLKFSTRGLQRVDARAGDTSTMTLRLPPRNVTVTIIARAGTRVSEPATLKLRWDGAAAKAVARPKLRALLVGVGGYSGAGITRLDYAAKDAADIEVALKAQAGKAYAEVETRLLMDANQRAVLSGLQWLEKSAEDNDVSVLFLAGHGVTDPAQRFFFLPVDADVTELLATAVSNDTLMGTIRRVKGRVAVFLDTCHSADGFNTLAGKVAAADMTRLSNEIASPENGAMLYAASTASQLAQEGTDGIENGAFTSALIAGLAGAADYDKNGQVETDELGLWLRKRVVELTGGAQEPIKLQSKPVPEFVLSLIK